jgi:hypothetical protein
VKAKRDNRKRRQRPAQAKAGEAGVRGHFELKIPRNVKIVGIKQAVGP